MAHNLITLLIILGLPGLLIYTEKRSKVIRWIGPIILCYLTGVLIANTHLLMPETAMLSSITEISICMAIPLLLFSTDLKAWAKHAKMTLVSFFISITGVVVISMIAYLIFSDRVPDAYKVSGMLVGVYTGGTPNMSAIGIAVDADEEVFILLNSADIIISGIYFIFLLSLAKPLLRLFLPAFRNGSVSEENQEKYPVEISIKKKAFHITAGLVLSALVFGTSIGLSLLLAGKLSSPLIILALTTIGIALSFSKRVKKIQGTYGTAEYLLFVFAIAMGSMANLMELIQAGPVIFLYCGFVVFFSIIFHYGVAALFRIDADTVIITSTAAIYGPAFVGPVANAIRNPKVIFSGIAMGLLGITFANYLGLLVAYILR